MDVEHDNDEYKRWQQHKNKKIDNGIYIFYIAIYALICKILMQCAYAYPSFEEIIKINFIEMNRRKALRHTIITILENGFKNIFHITSSI